MRPPFVPIARVSVLLIASLLFGDRAVADVKLPRVFSHHAVLQREQPLPIWGWADPGEEVTVTLGEQTKTALTNGEGKWQIQLDKLKAGGPRTLTVKGRRNKLVVNDLLVGEVWLASGQSNMVHIMPTTFDFAKERPQADHPELRIFTVARAVSQTPKDDCLGNWLVLSPTTVDDVSAVAYYFGRELHQKLGVPVGVVVSALGGTPSWGTFPTCPAFRRIKHDGIVLHERRSPICWPRGTSSPPSSIPAPQEPSTNVIMPPGRSPSRPQKPTRSPSRFDIPGPTIRMAI